MLTEAMKKRSVVGKKLLVASLGVAAVSYVACSGQVAGTDAGADAAADAAPDNLVTSGNLVPPPADATPPRDAAPDVPPTSGNLMPPPPPDAGDDGGASDGGSD
jgi:hypothetical protein